MKKDLGTILKNARISKGFSQADIAEKLKLKSAQSISDWERNYGSGVPIQSLKALIRVYDLDPQDVFDALLEYQTQKLEQSLTQEFYSKAGGAKRR